MPSPPAEQVTFLFTDIEGSTELLTDFPEAGETACLRHRAIVDAAVILSKGWVFNTGGDACYCAFNHPADALRAAVEAQRALASEPWDSLQPGFPPVRVRMAIHSGPAKRTGADFLPGPTLTIVARLLAAGHGGQVLLSCDSCDAIAEQVPDGVTLLELGSFRLRGIATPMRLFRAQISGIPPVDTPPDIPIAGPVSVQPGDPSGLSPGTLIERIVRAVRAPGDGLDLSPEDVHRVLQHRPKDLTEYRALRVAEWSHERYQIDQRFVHLSLLLDHGPEAHSERWRAGPERFTDLREILAAVHDPALVVLGPPGGGKTTLLRRLELDLAIDGIRGADTVTFWLPLNSYHGSGHSASPPAPMDWLSQVWRKRYPQLPPLASFIQEGRLVLLLDALNEMPHRSEDDYRERVHDWRELTAEIADHPGNRLVFSCRSLDYSALLSSPDLPVPQVQVEPLDDAQIRAFLAAYNPYLAPVIWDRIQSPAQLGLMRSPYFLDLMLQLVEADGEVPGGRVALFTSFVRRSLLREIERDHPDLEPGLALTHDDHRRLSIVRHWPTPYQLPEDGPLFPGLAGLAYGMQVVGFEGEPVQLRASWSEAERLVGGGPGQARAVLRAGTALGILTEDVVEEEVLFAHQLLQEYFAARHVARYPRPFLARSEWRADKIRPSLEATLAALAPSDPLPPAPASGWEETMRMAAAMTAQADTFLSNLAEANLALAGASAAQAEVNVSERAKESLRWDLVARTRDPRADLRARIAAGLALGELGDPRFERREGPFGPYLLPPFIEIPGGTYRIGSDDGIFPEEEAPEHEVEIAPFKLAQFPVTNAEWALFMRSGGYEDERWWETEDAKAWRRGEGTGEGTRWSMRLTRRQLQEEPGALDRQLAEGVIGHEIHRAWSRFLAMSDEEFESHIQETAPDDHHREPQFWRNRAFAHPALPVVGISWYEALAYCRWIALQSGLAIRLPSEAEWEAAARGPLAWRFPYGDTFDPFRGNTVETHVRQPTPVGVFPEGDTPTGLVDMCGNTADWTRSLFDGQSERPRFVYPYRADDGREDPAAPDATGRVARGGSWTFGRDLARSTCRYSNLPSARYDEIGLRLSQVRTAIPRNSESPEAQAVGSSEKSEVPIPLG